MCRLPVLFARVAGCGLLFAAVGCAEHPAQVSGRVTEKGVPVDAAELVFVPAAGPEERFPGNSRESGAYKVSYRGGPGLPAGKYRVAVTRYRLGGKPLGGGEAAQRAKEDGRATSETFEFDRDLVPGANVLDFELTQGEKRP